jgi:hypothetical protein
MTGGKSLKRSWSPEAIERQLDTLERAESRPEPSTEQAQEKPSKFRRLNDG